MTWAGTLVQTCGGQTTPRTPSPTQHRQQRHQPTPHRPSRTATPAQKSRQLATKNATERTPDRARNATLPTTQHPSQDTPADRRGRAPAAARHQGLLKLAVRPSGRPGVHRCRRGSRREPGDAGAEVDPSAAGRVTVSRALRLRPSPPEDGRQAAGVPCRWCRFSAGPTREPG